MIKKTIFVGFFGSAFFTHTSDANICAIKSALTLGPQVGVSHGAGTFDVSFNDGGLPPIIANASGGGKNNVALVGLLAAYRHVIMPGYTVGIDVSANYIGMNEIHKYFLQSVFPFFNRLKRTYNVIPSFTVGAILNDRFLISAGLGLGISRFTLQVDNIAGGVHAKSSMTRFAFAPSASLEYATTPRLSLIANMTYEIYQKVGHKFNSYLAPTLPGSMYTTSIKPKYLTIKAGFVFKF